MKTRIEIYEIAVPNHIVSDGEWSLQNQVAQVTEKKFEKSSSKICKSRK